MNLTGDINILVSLVNMKLRDEFSSLDDLEHHFNWGHDELTNKMNENGFVYDVENNQFKRK